VVALFGEYDRVAVETDAERAWEPLEW